MLYDLNVLWLSSTSPKDIERTLSFFSELNYSVVALNHVITSAVPSKIENPIPTAIQLRNQLKLPSKLTILRRCTVTLVDPAHNHRLPAFASSYDILALRPTTEKAFLAACLTLNEHSLISLDLGVRYPFHFKPKPLMTAVKRGIRFEICYAQATQGDANARRNLISNVLAIVRATAGRGLVISSEAKGVLGVRAPADVLNLLQVWGLAGEKASEAMSVNPRAVVMNEAIKRRGYRGIIDVVEDETMSHEKAVLEGQNADRAQMNGQIPHPIQENVKSGKRKTNDQGEGNEGPNIGATPHISKRQAKRMRMEALHAYKSNASPLKAGLSAVKDQIDAGITMKAKANG